MAKITFNNEVFFPPSFRSLFFFPLPLDHVLPISFWTLPAQLSKLGGTDKMLPDVLVCLMHRPVFVFPSDVGRVIHMLYLWVSSWLTWQCSGQQSQPPTDFFFKIFYLFLGWDRFCWSEMRQSIWNQDFNGKHTQTNMHVVSGAGGRKKVINSQMWNRIRETKWVSCTTSLQSRWASLKHRADFILWLSLSK